jgi:hypothetical protein
MVDEIEKLKYDMNDWHMDGFCCWGQKQKLYRILWAAEEALKDAPYFVGEDEWLKENNHEREVPTITR